MHTDHWFDCRQPCSLFWIDKKIKQTRNHITKGDYFYKNAYLFSHQTDPNDNTLFLKHRFSRYTVTLLYPINRFIHSVYIRRFATRETNFDDELQKNIFLFQSKNSKILHVSDTINILSICDNCQIFLFLNSKYIDFSAYRNCPWC